MIPTTEKLSLESQRKLAELSIIPKSWRAKSDIPSVEEMCQKVQNDPIFADRFFFPESYNWHNYYSATFEPLYDFQGLITKTCEDNQVVWIQASRGSAKSYTIARWLVSYCLRHPYQAVKIIAPSFRQSRQLFDYCLQIIKTNSQIDSLLYKLEQDIPEDNIKRGHEVVMTFINGSSIEALPAGNGDTLRGKRATVLVCDEFYLFPREIYTSHIVPFLNVKKGAQPAKLIHITTSYYQDVFAYSVLMDIAKYQKQGRKGYKIIDITLDDVINSNREDEEDEPDYTPRSYPAALPMILHQLETGTDKVTGQLSDEMLMTFYNKWIKSSANWYRTDKVLECQKPEIPVLSNMPKGSEIPFVLGVDPAGMGNDSTQMAVLSLPGQDLRHIHAVYKWDKIQPEEIAGHIHSVVDKFPNIKKIVLDKSGTLGKQIASLCERKTQLIDGMWQERVPITVHDHPDAMFARAHIILTLPSDELMESGLFGARVDSKIGGEIELKNAFHIDMKSRFENYSILAPQIVDDAEYYGNEKTTKGELLDNIREALSQFPKIDRKKDREGKPIVDQRGNFMFNRPPHDDGAYSIVYANWCANIVYKAAIPKKKTEDPPIFWGIQDDDEAEADSHTVVHARLF